SSGSATDAPVRIATSPSGERSVTWSPSRATWTPVARSMATSAAVWPTFWQAPATSTSPRARYSRDTRLAIRFIASPGQVEWVDEPVNAVRCRNRSGRQQDVEGGLEPSPLVAEVVARRAPVRATGFHLAPERA